MFVFSSFNHLSAYPLMNFDELALFLWGLERMSHTKRCPSFDQKEFVFFKVETLTGIVIQTLSLEPFVDMTHRKGLLLSAHYEFH